MRPTSEVADPVVVTLRETFMSWVRSESTSSLGTAFRRAWPSAALAAARAWPSCSCRAALRLPASSIAC
eukprot:1734448-Alexandrium_andersonii.AAC.1